MSPDEKRTAAGLRELLFNIIDGVKAGSVDDKTARTIATLAQTILKSVEVELQFRAQVGSGAVIPADIGELQLTGLPQPKAMNGQPRLVRGKAQSGSL